jgi:aminomethyltransferase
MDTPRTSFFRPLAAGFSVLGQRERSGFGQAKISRVTSIDTPLRAAHERLGATMTEFAGWRMPLRYGSETAEHNAVRTDAALFDLSHMGEVAVSGPGAGAALDYALTGWPSKLAEGRARYTMICAPDGGILDDLVVYRQAADRFLVVANASNVALVHAELAARCAAAPADGGSLGEALVRDESAATGLISIQGPNGCRILSQLTDFPVAELAYYAGGYGTVAGRAAWIARTGYTGEDGFELFCAPEDCEPLWEALLTALTAAGSAVPAAGLAARDTLRLEAGMPLYGNELGPDITPYEAGLGKVVRLDKPGDFVGRAALAARQAEGPARRLTGLVVQSRRVPRHGYAVVADGSPVGVVTSGAPSATLGRPIAMAYVETGATGPFGIDVRGKTEPAEETGLPFYDRRKKR